MSNKADATTMKQAIKRELKPKLRFPEFLDDWAAKKLGELGTLSGGGTPDKSVAEYWQGDIPWVSSSDIYEDDIYTLSVTRFINEKSISESATKIVPKGSVLFVSRVGTGKLAVNDRDVCTSQDFMNFIPKKVSSYFLGYFFIANKSALVSLGQGTSIKGFSKGDLEKLEVSFPSVTEQQKIADCLASLDELIAAETQKLATLKAHKKGLMQQLFPAEGETLPKLRFPEFRDAGEWEEKPFDELFTIGNGKDYKHLPSGDVPVYGSGGYMLSVNDYLHEGESVCIGRKGTINNPMFLTGKFWTVDTLFYTHSFNDCLPRFIYSIFQNIDWLKHNEAGGVPSLSKTNIGKIKVAVPKPKEQQKIADFLSSLDELIAAETQKLATLKAHKKGLMQQLFPALDDDCMDAGGRATQDAKAEVQG